MCRGQQLGTTCGAQVQVSTRAGTRADAVSGTQPRKACRLGLTFFGSLSSWMVYSCLSATAASSAMSMISAHRSCTAPPHSVRLV